MRKPSYYRARITAINSLINQVNEAIAYDESKGNTENIKENEFNRSLLRNGFVYPGNLRFPSFEKLGKDTIQELRNHKYSDDPLTFQELTKYNTWFAIHPEKIAGREEATTSREFPVTVKGSKEQIIATLKADQQTDQQTELELEAIALELELQLLNSGLDGPSIFTKPSKKLILR